MNMKKILLLIGFIAVSLGVSAQKYSYVDTDYILKNIPEYTSAKSELNSISVKWQKEIEEKIAEVDKMYNDLQIEKILLTEDLRIKREEEIIKKEREVKDLQMKRFGADGDLFKKQQELIKPIQDKVYNAIMELAESKGIGMVFDKAGSTTVIYSQAKYNISDDVLRQMGYVPGANDVEEDVQDEEEGDLENNNSNNNNSNNRDNKSDEKKDK
jgi:outer membrane protein